METTESTKKGQTLDRVDNEKGYYKDNCMWRTQKENSFNKRTTRLFEINGHKFNLWELSQITGLTPGHISQRVRLYNLDIMEAILKKNRYSNRRSYEGTKEDLEKACEVFKTKRRIL